MFTPNGISQKLKTHCTLRKLLDHIFKHRYQLNVFHSLECYLRLPPKHGEHAVHFVADRGYSTQVFDPTQVFEALDERNMQL